MIPVGSVGIVKASSFIGKLIAKRQGLPYSHVVIYIGNGEVLDSTWKWTRIRPIEYWERREVTWFAPLWEFNDEEQRSLRSLAKMIRGRIKYDWWALFQILLYGTVQGRRHGLFCSYLVAEIYMVIKGWDISRTSTPWTVDVRSLFVALKDEDDFFELDWRLEL